jgi:UDP-glucose 4-epimerase
MKQNVIVTGGAGFIGSHLVPLLLENGYSVIVLDSLCKGRIENLRDCLRKPQFKFLKADIRDKEVLLEAFRESDIVIHLAALIDVAASVSNPALTHEVNVTGTLNVLQAAAKNNVKRVVFASSTAVYGDPKDMPIKESTNLQPISPYAASKAASEAYCTAFRDCYGLDAISLRFFNVYGLGNENNPYSGVITKFLLKALKSEGLTVYGDGEQTRDFIHVSDVVTAILCALCKEELHGGCFNICTGVPTSINQLVKAIRAVTNKDLPVSYVSSRQGEIRYSCGDPTKAFEQLGFKSQVGLSKGLSIMFAGLKQQAIQ